MTVHTVAAAVGVDQGDVEVVIGWLAAEGERLDDAMLELDLRAILDPADQRTRWVRSACPECGRLPGPDLVLVGWHPCACGGHATTYCRADTGGCGHTRYEPELDPEGCSEPEFGFGSEM
jgi:hypothetical protein